MPAKDDGPPWFKRIGIDKTCRLVAMCRGMVTLTVDPDDVHTLWIFDHPLERGTRDAMRARYATYDPVYFIK